MSDCQPVISLEDVWVRYGQIVALQSINLRIMQREIISIVGSNGGGKTTLLLTILGFIHPDRGQVTVLGKKPDQIQSTGRIGYLPQTSESVRRFPIHVFDVVAMTRYARKRPGQRLHAEDRTAIIRALEMVEMAETIDQPFGNLSGGQQQRVRIARALAGEPEILILDEPSTGLDAVAQDTFYHLLKEIRNERSLTILMVSHDIGSVSTVVDRIACLNKQIHFHGKPSSTIPSDALERTFGRHVHFLIHDEHCKTCENKR